MLGKILIIIFLVLGVVGIPLCLYFEDADTLMKMQQKEDEKKKKKL